MKLPNSSAARVELEKIRGYLLAESHPVGRSKAAFFMGLGFSPDRPEELLAALMKVGRSDEIVDQTITPYGTKYVVDGDVRGREGVARVRTVWILERNTASPRLITAYAAPTRKT